MLCPKCNKEMLIIEMNNVEADWCPECKGIWLDDGELEIISNTNTASGRNDIMNAIRNPNGINCHRKCPRCRNFMKTSLIPTSPKIELDICSNRHGVWFDNGELEKILNELSGEPLSEAIQSLLKK